VHVSLGNFDSIESGARAAVRGLSKEIHKCGQAKVYSVSWKFPAGEQERGWLALKYTRRDKTSGIVGYEYDPDSGTRDETFLVDDSAVDEVAKEGGALSDFAKYEKKKP